MFKFKTTKIQSQKKKKKIIQTLKALQKLC